MSDMATIELAYIKSYVDRHGRPRCYYRRKGFPVVALPPPDEEGFLDAYQAAGRREPVAVGSKRTEPGSVSALIVAYYASADYQGLADSTRRSHKLLLDRFREEHGTKRVATLKPKHLAAIFHGMAKTPAQAANLRKRLGKVFDLGVELGWRDDNPIINTKAPKYRVRGFAPWTEDQIAQYEAHWPSGTRERLAMALFLYTGQRRSDVAPMGRQHVKNGRVRVRQQKGSSTEEGHVLWIPIHPTLRTEVEAHAGELTFLLTNYGKPFSVAGLGNWFGDAARAAGLKHRTAHGLRKAAGRRLAEAGCTAKQIMAILGHKTLQEAEKYVRDADQVKLADSAMQKQLEAEA